MNATDKDKRQPENITYRIIGGNNQDLFELSGGELRLVKSLNNSAGQIITLMIEASDSKFLCLAYRILYIEYLTVIRGN